MIFRKLTEEEVQVFRAWARKHYQPFTAIDGVWHPVVQAECVKINEEVPLVE